MLARRGARRLGVALPLGSDPAASLAAVADHLERRLEVVTIEAARRVGLAVDVEVDVLPGEVSFHVGPELKVDALAGFDLSRDRVVLGSFRRAVAVAHEEHDSFATGHPLVEALFGWVRDGELGRATVYRTRVRTTAGAALDARFLVTLPEPADLAQGAKVPSRRASRHLDEALIRVVAKLDGRGGAQASEELAAQLDSAQTIESVPVEEDRAGAGSREAGDRVDQCGLAGAVRPDQADDLPRADGQRDALAGDDGSVANGHVALERARRRLAELIAQAKERAKSERDSSLKRLQRWLSQTKAKGAERERILEEEAHFHDAAISALEGARLELDQLALVQLL